MPEGRQPNPADALSVPASGLSRRGSIPSPHNLGNRLMRSLWAVAYVLAFRPSPKIFHGWRRFLLRMFGARVATGAVIHPSVRIWAPWNLEMKPYASLGPFVDCYNVAPVTLGAGSTVSQRACICTATHDYTKRRLPLVAKTIQIGADAWVCADVFLHPGVTVGEGAVVGARSVVAHDVPAWTIVSGMPARFLKQRVLVD
jgi:putative colanic acid biosynthesis acetyltransferase WcaF